jgi:hypothetical protein
MTFPEPLSETYFEFGLIRLPNTLFHVVFRFFCKSVTGIPTEHEPVECSKEEIDQYDNIMQIRTSMSALAGWNVEEVGFDPRADAGKVERLSQLITMGRKSIFQFVGTLNGHQSSHAYQQREPT